MNSASKSSTHSGALRSPGPLANPMLSFDLNAEIEALRKENAWQGGRDSKTLVKHRDFRIVLTVLQSGARLHEHKAAGRIAVQTLAGHIRMHVGETIFDLAAGHVLALERALPHDVEALEASAFLLTICWPEDSETSETR